MILEKGYYLCRVSLLNWNVLYLYKINTNEKSNYIIYTNHK